MICGVGSSSLRGGHSSFWKQKTAQWRQIQQFGSGGVDLLCVYTPVGSHPPGVYVHVDLCRNVCTVRADLADPL